MCTVFAGHDVASCNKYYVVVCRNILPDIIQDFITALAVMFACYFVFNLEYNASCLATLEYIQR